MRLLVATSLLAIALPCAAQPRLTNARITERPVAGTLEGTIRQVAGAAAEPGWIAWAAPVAEPHSTMCCFEGTWHDGAIVAGTCRLEPGSWSTTLTQGRTASTALELPDVFYIFARVESRRLERVRMFSENCAIDAGGGAVTWLTGVKPAESVAYLSALARDTSAGRRSMKGALSALAQHGVPEAVPALVRLARESPESKIRGEALFWLSQRAGARAAGAITDAIEHDPETEVKKRAVFALSQLPPDEGVPRLIEVARTHRNPAVKKQAMFWLGQSKDPRALAFFEEVLK